MKLISIALLLLLSTLASASPITVDAIYSPDGLTINSGQAVLSLPINKVSEAIVTQSNSVQLSNKTFGKSSFVPKQFRYVYDYSILGGATSAAFNMGAALPAKAIITRAWYDVVTQPVALAGSPTFGVDAASTGDVVVDIAVASLTTGVHQGVEQATIGTALKLAAASNLTLNIKAGSVNAGKIVFFIDYLISE